MEQSMRPRRWMRPGRWARPGQELARIDSAARQDRTGRNSRRAAAFAALLAAAALACGAQSGQPDQSPASAAQAAAKAAIPAAGNADRKKQIAGETARLLQMATDLKAEVDKTDKDTLSLAVIRKADEIEKLAHDFKEQMKSPSGAN